MEGFRGLVKRCCMPSRDPYEIKRTCGTYAPHFFAQIMFQFDKITALNIDKLGGFRHYCPVIRALDPAPNTHEAELMKRACAGKCCRAGLQWIQPAGGNAIIVQLCRICRKRVAKPI